jgi:hypothetical protein
MLFAAVANLVEGLRLSALLTLKIGKLSDLPCRHTNTSSVHGGMTIYFSLEIINKK